MPKRRSPSSAEVPAHVLKFTRRWIMFMIHPMTRAPAMTKDEYANSVCIVLLSD